MAHMGCECGADMWDGDGHIVYDVFSFKDLKDYIEKYAKYLGLDKDEIIDSFNTFMFERTSKIPMDKIEEAIKVAERDRKN